MYAWFAPIRADNESADGSLSEITIEQLHDCAILLALSVVHHRAKFGFVPIAQSASEMMATKGSSGSSDLLVQSKRTLEEALRYVKALSPNPSDSRRDGQPPKAGLEEKRRQIRISISAPIEVLPLGETSPLKAKLENISWGGAAFHVDRSIGEVGDSIEVYLPSFRSRRITVHAEIIRASDEPDGRTYVVRFSNLRTADEALLRQLLAFLTRSGDDNGQRVNARLAQRIDIQYDDASELRATLEDISTGGMGLTLPEPMNLEQSLLVGISTTDEQCELLLRARVVRQQEVFFSELQMFRVGLEFEHPTEDIKARVNEMIRSLTTINASASV